MNACLSIAHWVALVVGRRRFGARLRCGAWLGLVCLAAGARAEWRLAETAQVDSGGVFLAQIATATNGTAVPHLQVADAPAPSQTLVLTRTQVLAALARAHWPAGVSNLCGAERVRITRKLRSLPEAEVRELLTATLQREHLRDRGELELRFTRPWRDVKVPDEPFVLKVVDLPASGISPSLILRFELRNEREVFGAWQVAAQAKVWREVYVAGTALRRGDVLAESDLARERRDVLTLRDALETLPGRGLELEVLENLAVGAPLTSRAVRLKPVVSRGQLVAASVVSGALTIALKVEVLEDGAPGQWVRVRNPQSKRELRGKVQHEQSILIEL